MERAGRDGADQYRLAADPKRGFPVGVLDMGGRGHEDLRGVQIWESRGIVGPEKRRRHLGDDGIGGRAEDERDRKQIRWRDVCAKFQPIRGGRGERMRRRRGENAKVVRVSVELPNGKKGKGLARVADLEE